jgi:hypothetical protein
MRQALAKALLVLIGVGLPLLVAEVGTRANNGAVFVLEDLRPGPWESWGTFTDYDPLLGWVPRPNSTLARPAGWIANTDGSRFRRNHSPGETVPLVGPPILAIGDSGAFGDEVNDHETWPAHLENRLGRRVFNAGVSAYGIDQAVLRAERLYPRLAPTIVVFSIVSDDVTRTGLEFWNRWKPCFRLEDDGLELTKPPGPDVLTPRSWWRTALGHSQIARFVMRRAFPEAWEHRVRRRAHHDEREVSGRLLQRLKEFIEARKGRLLVVLTAGGNANVHHIGALREQAIARGITVLDLSDELARLARDPLANKRMFRPAYHPSSVGNAWIAEQIEDRLVELQWLHRDPD